ncbi:MAG TPA: LacI family DNA-binding transcriptional regulator [Ktedonobacteraceae bacterium]
MAQQRKKKTTIREVAQHAGVSYQTVSRVLNASDNVAEDTRKRVQQTMLTLGFVPNKIAQMLITNRSQTLELIVVDIVYAESFTDPIKNMARTAHEAGYSLLVTMAEVDQLATVLANAAARLIEGIVMYAPSLRMSDEQLLALCAGIPLVRRDYIPYSRLAWVGFDQVHATRMAVEYLLSLGHQQIAAIPPSLDLINGQWRYETWQETLRKYQLEPGPMCESKYTFSGGYSAMCDVLDSRQPFTAIMVGSDTMALGALRALRERGLRVPEDISLLSFDNVELAAFTDPPLTTIHFDFKQQDTMVINYLLEILNNPDMKLYQRVLLPDLIIRQSTRNINGA